MKLSLKQSWLSPLTLRYYKTIMYMYFSLVRSQPKKWSGVTQLQWFLQIIQFQKQFDLSEVSSSGYIIWVSWKRNQFFHVDWVSWKKNQFISPRLSELKMKLFFLWDFFGKNLLCPVLSNFEKILCVRIHESICRQKWQKPSRKGFLKRFSFRWFLWKKCS